MADLKRAHVWGAIFETTYQKLEFFKEQYSDDDSIPINAFAASQGSTFYDHDNFIVEGVSRRSIDELLEELPVPESNRNTIVEAWLTDVDPVYNTVIIGDEDYFSAPTSCKVSGIDILYVGAFHFYGRR